MRESTRIVLRRLVVFCVCAPTFFIGVRYGFGVLGGATGMQLLHELRASRRGMPSALPESPKDAAGAVSREGET